jgi:hypothetical protein
MFATVAGALLWAWTSLGAGSEIVFLILPNAFGWTPTIDAGLARLLFSWTLHAIVYFWLIPAYIAFYVLLPQAAGGRLYSDKMGRIAFLLLLAGCTSGYLCSGLLNRVSCSGGLWCGSAPKPPVRCIARVNGDAAADTGVDAGIDSATDSPSD